MKLDTTGLRQTRNLLAWGPAGQWAARLSWLVVLLDPIGHPLVQTPLTLLAVVGLLSRRLCWNAAMWMVAAALAAAFVLDDPTRVDNHAYLRVYWFVALALSATRGDPGRALAGSARGLIAGVFVMALLWKVLLSPDFLSGDYFRFTLMTDTRFSDFASLTAGLSPADQMANRGLLRSALGSDEFSGPLGFIEPPALARVAHAMTAWTLLIEAFIALSFLAPLRLRLSRLRDVALIAFGITTYAVATVEGFGWLLCCIGLAQSDAGRSWVRFAYVACFLVILGYAQTPWLSWWVQLVG